MVRKIVVGLLLLSGAMAVAQRTEKSSPEIPKADEQVMERSVLVIENMSNIVETDSLDCGKMALDLNRLYQNSSQAIAAAKAGDKRMTQEAHKALLNKFKARLDRAMLRVQQNIPHCSKDPGVDSAMKQFK